MGKSPEKDTCAQRTQEITKDIRRVKHHNLNFSVSNIVCVCPGLEEK